MDAATKVRPSPPFHEGERGTPPPASQRSGAVRHFIDFSVLWKVAGCLAELLDTRVYNVDDLKEVASANKMPTRLHTTPDKLAEMVSNVEEVVKKQVPEIVSKMGLYLQNSSTRTILFKPTKSNILEAHGQVLSLLDSDYTPEEAAQVPIMNLSDLQTFLDGLC